MSSERLRSPQQRRTRRGRHVRGEERSPRRELLEWSLALAIALAIGLFLHFLVFQLIRVDGPSMQPTLHTGQRMFCTPATYMLRKPVRGEVVITAYPHRDGDNFVKRVIGLPGERVSIHDGAVYIDGEPLDEPYIKETIFYDMDEITVPEDSVFVLGDNRNDSSDSHDTQVGALPLSMLKAKVHAVVWPLSEFKLIATPSYD
jgi:signal peptidase I